MAEWDLLNWQTMVIELAIGLSLAFILAWKFRSKITEDIFKKLQKKESTRDTQFLQQMYDSFTKLENKMEGLQHWAKVKDLLIKQHKDAISEKNNLVDNMKIILNDPMHVIETGLKNEMLGALQLARYKPAWEALGIGEPEMLKKKKLEAGWRSDFTDFDIKERLVDNETEKAIEAIKEVIEKLSKELKVI